MSDIADRLFGALDAFCKAIDAPGGPSLAVQRHDPSWAAWKNLCDVSDEYRAALPLCGPPEGWQLVPKEPTETMGMAGSKAWSAKEQNSPNTRWAAAVIRVYRAMLASAPAPAQGWRDIATAPKDRMFIWAVPRGNGYWGLGLAYPSKPGWSDAYGSDAPKKATLWADLPPPPSQGEQGTTTTVARGD